MDLSTLFRPADLLVDFHAVDKWNALDKLMDHVVASAGIGEEISRTMREAVLLRERSMSTGMERGIAIPHAAVEGIEDVLACIGVVSRDGGLAFDSIDGQPTQFVVLLLIPKAKKLVHIRTLADIARVLGQDAVRAALLAARSGEEAWHALSEWEGAHPA
ncbi:MAG: PTS sugar transporter subunit IIA [Planctomycetota bacterium]|nr:PTS sugar transporter subunit IIA [Planctomycetota bacterium]